jgi:RHS repeat-associated protein
VTAPASRSFAARSSWRAALLALASVLVPATASASLPSASGLPHLTTLEAAAPSLDVREIQVAPRETCQGPFCAALRAATETRVRGFELELSCSIGGEDRLTCTPPPVYGFAYDGTASDRPLNAKARYFDPQLGRFLTQDSYLGQIDNPPSLHRYFYGHANPTRYIDPTGHGACPAEVPCVDLAKEALKKGAQEGAKQTAKRTALRLVGGKAVEAAAEGAAVEAGAGTAAASGSTAMSATGIGLVVVGGAMAAGGFLAYEATEAAKLRERETLAALQNDRVLRRGVIILEHENASQRLVEDRLREELRSRGIELGTADVQATPRMARSRSQRTPSPASSGILPQAPQTEVTPWGTRDLVTGKFTTGPRAGVDPVDDFIAHAEANGLEVVGREVTFRTPFGLRRADVLVRNTETGKIHGVEVKSTDAEFDKLNPQQAAADKWINAQGARATGQKAKDLGITRIEGMVKIRWEVK